MTTPTGGTSASGSSAAASPFDMPDLDDDVLRGAEEVPDEDGGEPAPDPVSR